MANYKEIELPGPSQVAMQLILNNLWQRSSKKSIVSGLWLRNYERTPLFANCFLHVLLLKDFPYFRYYFKNIILVTPGEAGLWSQGSEEERIQYSLNLEEQSKGKCTANWSILKRLDEELRAEYKRVFPSTRGMIVAYRYSLEEQKQLVGRLNKKFLENMKK